MAKNFKFNNPATQFISGNIEETQKEISAEPKKAKKEKPIEHKQADQDEYADVNDTDIEVIKRAAVFKGIQRGRTKSKEEVKDKRVQLLTYPSTFMALKKIAAIKNTSTNELINNIVNQYILDNTELLSKYDDIFKD